jgi:hypothetical protein
MEAQDVSSNSFGESIVDQAIPAPAEPSAIVELRQYALHPGQRDTLIELFESRLVVAQESTGMRLHGEFRDANDPDRFVWLRGFPDMPTRARALEAFYGGPVWQANREAANATMVDSDNVLLLRPLEKPGFSLANRMSPLIVATIYLLRTPVDDAFVKFFDERVKPAMMVTGAPPMAALRTEVTANNFPKLPVRESEHAFVWFGAYGSRDEYQRHLSKLADSKLWSAVEGELAARLKSPPARLELNPTEKSLRRNGQRGAYPNQRTGDLHDSTSLEDRGLR